MAGTTKADPELLKQLNSAENDAKPVQAWVRLKPKDPAQEASSPEETESLANTLVQRVEKRVGKAADSVNVLQNLGAFIVSAHPHFVRELIQQPEIESVKSTNAPVSLIRPVKSKEVQIARPAQRAKRAAKNKRPPR